MQRNNDIDHGRGFDWGKASQDYAKFRDIYPDEFYKRITDMGYCLEGQRVLDLGTGTGVLPRNLSKYGASFVGADIAKNQIEYARALSCKAGLDIEYIVSPAEELSFPEKSFDVVTACQCFKYFNKSKLLPNIHNFLKDDGHFLILFMAWLSEESEIAKKSEELVLKYNPDWTGCGIKRYKPQAPDFSEKLFTVSHAITYDIAVCFTRESWHGRMKACRGIGASSLSEEEIAEWEKEHLAFLDTVPESFSIPHFVTVLDLKKRQK